MPGSSGWFLGGFVTYTKRMKLELLGVPYVGAGVGYQWATLQNLVGTSAAGSGVTANSTQGSFAYQAIVGADFDDCAGEAPEPSIAPRLRMDEWNRHDVYVDIRHPHYSGETRQTGAAKNVTLDPARAPCRKLPSA